MEPESIQEGIEKAMEKCKPARDGQPIEDGQLRLRVHRKSNRLEVVPNSFLFQEGHAKHYDDAKYGVFKVDRSGKNLLVDLADKDHKVIDPTLINKEDK